MIKKKYSVMVAVSGYVTVEVDGYDSDTAKSTAAMIVYDKMMDAGMNELGYKSHLADVEVLGYAD